MRVPSTEQRNGYAGSEVRTKRLGPTRSRANRVTGVVTIRGIARYESWMPQISVISITFSAASRDGMLAVPSAVGPRSLSHTSVPAKASTNSPTNSSIALNDISFDHRVGAGEEGGWDRKAERFRGREINDEFKLCRLLDRQVAGFRPAQDLST